MKRNIIFGIIFLLLGGVVFFRIINSKDNSTKASSGFSRSRGPRGPVAVQVQQVQYGPMELERQFTGTIKAAYEYTVATKVAGRLTGLSKRIGDRVKKKEIIGYIEDTEYKQSVAEAKALVKVSRASVSQAQAQLKNAEAELKRVKGLADKGIISEAERDAVETKFLSLSANLEVQEALLSQREASLAKVQTLLRNTEIRTAQPGYVSERRKDNGSLLTQNTPVISIVGIDTVFVEIAVSELDYHSLVIGQNAKITVEALPGETITGVISHKAPQFDVTTRTASVEITVDNQAKKLKPGMFAHLVVILANKKNAQIIPQSALVSRGQKKAVFVINQEKVAQYIPVSLGIINHEKIEILEPHLKGFIVTVGHHLLYDGAKVILASDSPDKKARPAKKGIKKVKKGANNG